MDKLSKDGFKLLHGLDHCLSLKEKVLGVCIDFTDLVVFQLNVTCLACWSNGERRAVPAEVVLKEYKRLIIDKDLDYFNKLTKRRCSR